MVQNVLAAGCRKFFCFCATECLVSRVLLASNDFNQSKIKETIMKKTTLIASGVLLFAGSIAGVATASSSHDREGHREEMFQNLDANGDDFISKDELENAGALRFSKIDENGDGFLSSEELQKAGAERAERRAQRMIKHLDKNDDGKLSMDEMKEMGERRHKKGKMMKHLDADEDGKISKDEFMTARAKRGWWGKHGDDHGRGHKEHHDDD
jgi:Ca2+-binding EF-hand superfamily protein